MSLKRYLHAVIEKNERFGGEIVVSRVVHKIWVQMIEEPITESKNKQGRGNLEHLEKLTKWRRNLLTKLFYGSTLLQLSIMHDKTDLIKKLLEIDNSQLHIPNMQGESAFKIALRSGNEENIMLIANGIDNTQEELLNLIQNRELNLLEDALDMINVSAEIRANLLTKAVEINAREYVLNLINSSKYLDANSNEPITSLIKKDIEAVDSYNDLSFKCSDSYEIKDSFGTMVIGETIESM